MKILLRLLLKTHHQRNRSGLAQTEKGMTLVELLVGSIMAFLIITPMLGFVVDMLNTDRREQVKSNTEQDLQAAVDFIAQDLSQAIYIYDNNPVLTTATTTGTGIPAIKSQLPPLPLNTNGTPILVFWKRQQIRNAVPVNATLTTKPSECKPTALPGKAGECNDTYVLSLVAYYQIKNIDATWCQPSGSLATCPTRIARYEIRDGVKNPNPNSLDPNNPYYSLTDPEEDAPDSAFNKEFNISKPTVNVTNLSELKASSGNPQVLVNYIDHSSTNVLVPTGVQCQTLLGVTPPTGPGATTFNPNDLLITDTSSKPTHSFYACVDTSKNIARVTLRGNSLRRLQANDAEFKTTSSAFFPTATVQVQGLGARGK